MWTGCGWCSLSRDVLKVFIPRCVCIFRVWDGVKQFKSFNNKNTFNALTVPIINEIVLRALINDTKIKSINTFVAKIYYNWKVIVNQSSIAIWFSKLIKQLRLSTSAVSTCIFKKDGQPTWSLCRLDSSPLISLFKRQCNILMTLNMKFWNDLWSSISFIYWIY